VNAIILAIYAKISGLSFPCLSRYTIDLPYLLPRPALAILLSYSFLLPFSASAWWETGHKTVARLAAAHLTPAARTRVAQILRVPDSEEAVADALAEASIWADHVKGQSKTAPWHYIDLALQDREADMEKRCEEDNCATARMRLFAAQLAAKTTPRDSHWSDLDALRFVVHLVGDSHQPLHAASDADQAGNCELLDPAVGRAKNVHAVWDGEIVKFDGRGR
jgi:nuclease S1